VAATVGVALALGGCAARGPDATATARFHAEDDPIGALLRHRAPAYGPAGTASAEASANAEAALLAQNYLGVKYRWGGNSPDTGFDCSGLVNFVMEKSLGLRLPRSAAQIAEMGVKVDRDALQPGDLVFFNTLGRRYSHVGIYMGDDRFVHSPSSGGVVRIESMSLAYWAKRYNGARRLAATSLAAANDIQ